MRGARPNVAPVGLGHCLSASLFGPLVPSALGRLASIGWTRRACVTSLAFASARPPAPSAAPPKRPSRASLKTGAGWSGQVTRLRHFPHCLLSLIDVDILFAELDLAPLLSTLHKPSESNGGW